MSFAFIPCNGDGYLYIFPLTLYSFIPHYLVRFLITFVRFSFGLLPVSPSLLFRLSSLLSSHYFFSPEPSQFFIFSAMSPFAPELVCTFVSISIRPSLTTRSHLNVFVFPTFVFDFPAFIWRPTLGSIHLLIGLAPQFSKTLFSPSV